MKRLVVVMAFALAAAACGGGRAAPTSSIPGPAATSTTTVAAPNASGLAALEAARGRWAASGLATYRYVFEDDCGECQPIAEQVVVWDGAPATMSEAPSVDEVFARVEAAIRAGEDVDVVYDGTLGYPVEVWIDREARAYDGGSHWLINDLDGGLPGDATSLEALEEAATKWQESRPLAYEFTTSIICDCELQGTLWTRVEGDRITDWEVDLETDASLTPVTVDELLADLAELFGIGINEAGVRITGSAQYHPELGYPTWIGLNIDIEDPEGELAYLPPRLVFTVRDLVAIEPELNTDPVSSNAEFTAARELWVATGPLDYTFELTVHDIVTAEIGDALTVTVVDGEVVDVTLDGQSVESASVPVYSIDQLFEVMALWKQSGTEVAALYDQADGHPVTVIRRSDEPLVISIHNLTER